MATSGDNNNNNNNNNNSAKMNFMWNNTNNNNRVFPQRSSPVTVDRRSENVGFESKNPTTGVLEGSGKPRGGGGNMQTNQYPIRPEAKDCLFFVHTGSCSFGSACRFNHPVPADQQERNNGTNSGNSFGNSTRIPCKFYRFGTCKFGASCRFSHSIPPAEPMQFQQYNSLGLPFRAGEKKICSFYMRTGLCGFGAACKFHHPEPVFIKGPKNRNPYASGEAMPRANGSNGGYIIQFPDSPQPYVATPMADHSGFQYPPADYGWNGYQVPELNQETQLSSTLQAPNFSSVASTVDATTFVDFPPLSRPMVIAKTTVNIPRTSKPVVLNEAGFPMRPGRKVCWYYESSGKCKFGVDCIFDHPQKSAVGKGCTTKSANSGGGDETPETRE